MLCCAAAAAGARVPCQPLHQPPPCSAALPRLVLAPLQVPVWHMRNDNDGVWTMVSEARRAALLSPSQPHRRCRQFDLPALP